MEKCYAQSVTQFADTVLIYMLRRHNFSVPVTSLLKKKKKKKKNQRLPI